MAAAKTPLGYDYLVKLLLIGDSAVGKSSLLLRVSDDTFDPSITPTIGIDFKLRTINLDGDKIKLQLTWPCLVLHRYSSVCSSVS